MFFKKRPPENYLSLTPIRVIKEFSENENKITLHVPKFKNERLRKFMIPGNKSPFFRIHLDEMGSNVWRILDDVSTVQTICDILKTKLESENNSIDQVEERVTRYLTDLYKNRFITLK